MDSLASYIVATASLFFYSVVYFPQFYIIYTTSDIQGVSIWMLLLWTQADFLSLFGSVFSGLAYPLILIGWYHVLVGLIMIVFVVFIEVKPDMLSSRSLFKLLYTFLFLVINTSFGIILTQWMPVDAEIGNTLGWVTTAVYFIGRFPQIYLNHKRKSTEGLSNLMYLFTICGNVLYVASIFVYSTDSNYILINLPWVCMTFVTVFMDLFVIAQGRYYKTFNANLRFEELD